MERADPHSATSTISVLAAWTAIAASGVALALLLSLHVLSPEFSPAWRMISEYEIGRHGWLIRAAVFCWSIGFFGLAVVL